ncbi:chloride channel protein [Mucilaginibacter rubeus]|uniref:Chloride channel protein n=1 Tax=Mucilaginibacter rubeus TaxID=2027860 RepID=A0A5C1HZ03_9SPHI|nr:chloride channel protein [Mucilaginibacter rubeus]QEM10709.1 chloride channel protein [Mucilaginibacter rubeus]
MKKNILSNAIPIAPLLNEIGENESDTKVITYKKARLIRISVYAVAVAFCISLIAKVLISLINLVTNISFYGNLDLRFHSPAGNHLGLWVIIIPAIGGILVGLMALYGSKAIRGHGIPEAMEQILVNESNIKPSITFLKPISSAIAIGTGGPFGAEGPIIATGGALGSTLGQLFKITSNERKIILAAGATAGMSAIFGTPIAAVFLAIELLLFEFSPRAILPVALACITGAAGHHLLFESGPVFTMPELAIPSNTALGIYSFMGIVIGFMSIGITKIVYFIEDSFEKLPIHWMWWPAIGGLAVGIIGYFAPHTLGVGYDNITGVLSGTWSIRLIAMLCFFKFLSWAIALGSGTSGGTLAPLLTIGGAAGALIGSGILLVFPDSGITIPLAALIGMSAMFAGASRAYLTSIVFALEATMQSHALLPLLGACTAAYLVSFFLMENTIMTEKIARRGVFTPDSFEPDVLQKMSVGQVISEEGIVINDKSTVSEVRKWLGNNVTDDNYLILVDDQGAYAGTIQITAVYQDKLSPETLLKQIVKQQPAYFISTKDSLRKALETMSKTGADVLPISSAGSNRSLVGVLSYKDIVKAYQIQMDADDNTHVKISLKRQRIKMPANGKELTGVNDK